MAKAKASHKTKGGKKDSATKNTFNAPAKGGAPGEVEEPGGTNEPFEQDAKRRFGNFTGAGEAAIIKK